MRNYPWPGNVRELMWHTACHMTKAAEELQISRATLYRLMEKYQINLEMLRSMNN